MKKTIQLACVAALLIAPAAMAQGSSAGNVASAVRAANGNAAATVAAVKRAVAADKANAAAIVESAVKALGANPSAALVADIVDAACKQAGAGPTQIGNIGVAAKVAAGNTAPVITAVNTVVIALLTANPLDIVGGNLGGIGGNGVNGVNDVNTGSGTPGEKPQGSRNQTPKNNNPI